MPAAVVKTNRRVLALADDADDAALGTTDNTGTRGPRRGRLGRRCIRTAWSGRSSATTSCAAKSGGLPGLLRSCHSTGADGLGGRDRVEIAAGDRVLVFLAQELLGHEEVDGRREGAWHLSLHELDGARILHAAEHELRFLLALRHLLPDRHGDGHHHGHQADRDEENGHCIAPFGSAGGAPGNGWF